MALQSSGAISITDIKTELGSSSNSLRTLSAAAGFSAPDAMSEFYGYSSQSYNFEPKIFTGISNPHDSVNFGFQPDLVIVKNRATTSWGGIVFDSNRGATKYLEINNTNQESTAGATDFAFTSTGFNLGSNWVATDAASNNYVIYGWQAGNNTASETSGSINSTVNVNQAGGFSIVTYTGNGQNATIGHGLGAAPDLVVVKSRTGGSYNWMTYVSPLGGQYHAYLNLTNAFENPSVPSVWNDTNPTSTVFSVTSNVNVNQSGVTYVAYCWKNITGKSQVGSYVGNSSGGHSITIGFRPKLLIIKCASQGNSYQGWFVHDDQRTYSANNLLYTNGWNLNSNVGEFSNTGTPTFDSTGFTLHTGGGEYNQNGLTYIYMAWG